ncbi:type II secretion system protein GspC [Vibrio europaeus]|uniref:Type II secretion system protein GspC n=1 Tax=Vibrio europaeus TaxID=300876 RepID=A0A178JBT9_9VIBR|nr:type II secretion system protein GspC [Vibrio europaeus]MDC5703175.1 type II secretion system protein GspC [Vibrio europaeus]MDC5708593.1 type II secretion system protein GspC [Vibrio europaeus]MDC5713067.1 type II secretion system protein GspC [Vibrio europaeus]MDC5718080.1 type II secretion system protein GspC [Vibrio europaeus]MDC5725487.1 type II secretion system protein GspC [Vibrio europaeus]
MALLKFGEALKDVAMQQRISYLVMMLLLTVSVWIGGQMLWQPWSASSVSQWQPSGVVSAGSSSSSQLDISELQNSNLFGKYRETAPVVEQPKVQDAPKSRLNVVLVGVVTSSNPEKSLAVIANRGQQATYGINEVIEGTRAKLVQVQPDRVIIDNSGRNETVMLEGLKYTKPSVTAVKAPESVTRSQVSPDSLNKIREEIRQDAKQIFQYVRMSQVKQDGEVVGYRLSPGKDRALFDAVGLKPGDIAISINGLDLKDSAAMGEVFRSLSQLTELNLTVERNGQPHEIYIEL